MIARLIVETLLDGPQVLPPELPPWVEEDEGYDPKLDTHDLALEYIEGEVGRFDHQHNWQQHKAKHGKNLREMVAAWLKHYEVDHDPDAIISYINDELMMRPGKWL
jgi:hypothetical protein